MQTLITTFQDRFSEWLESLFIHLQISLLSLLIAMIIAIPLAIWLTQYKKASEMLLQITGIFQTIPSLALLGLFIPFMGIGTLPAVVALVIYALFPILQNTLTGFAQIDDNLIEAATAFGMTRWERLKKFELALAMPVIISGVRTAAVMIIGTATLAALIGAGGLGSFILLGIDRNNTSLILIGAISSAGLALLFSWAIKALEKARLKTIGLWLLTLFIGVGLSYTPNFLKKAEQKPLIIAGKLGTEPEILINMYQLLIEEKSDIKVQIKPNFGKTSFLYEALKSGDIDLYPEFTGTITSSLLASPPKISNDPDEVYQAARDGIASQDKLTLLKPMAYQNTYAIAIKRDYAKSQNLHKISDLKRVENTAQAGFTLEFNDREDGNIGLKNRYQLNLKVKTLEPALRYQAINNDEVQIIDAYSTDSELIKYNLVTLEDDLHLFPPYQGAPLLRSQTLTDYPELENILNQLAGKITAEEMSQMNYQVAVEGKAAHDVARAYLIKAKLLKNSD